ncbi:TonB-dependent receptor domain-containing protein [Pseudoalteromonas ulvae]|uniref:TonB-dependent receptor n=1 Tax=Pseudoalteromonas ulvae TaxID=107327 RepID=A0A244CRC8_PSEDV|nr:TonB-dependent receptor [Pseudoalteromonas ulvae]OUL58180.1 TonB-dependent receptor [Pseudoalteromonas ulvae]
MACMPKIRPLSLSIALILSSHAVLASSDEIEEVSVIAKKISYANHQIDTSMTQQQNTVSSVLGLMDNLPGISINEGDAFGGDDWSTSITMRGFSIDGNQQQLGMTVDGIPNGGSNYGGGAKANRYLETENLATVEVGQGTADLASASLEALGGTFNFVSIDPSSEKQTTIAYTTGDHDASRYFVRHQTGQVLGHTRAYISYSQTDTSRWIGEGSNGGTTKQHAEFKFISDFEQLSITGRLSFDDVEEDNYNSVSIAQFKQTPDWDQLTWNWTGVPHFDQMFAEGWSTLRENTLGYLKFDYALSSTSSLTFTPYLHKNSGRGDWIPPYLVKAVDENGLPTHQGGSVQSKYGFTDLAGNALSPSQGCESSYSWPWESGNLLHSACYPADAVPVMSYRHTHYKKDRFGVLADYQVMLQNHDIKVGLWYEDDERTESRDWHKVIDARVYHHFDQTPYWTQYKNVFNTDTLKLYVQDSINFSDFTLNLGAQKYMVDIEKHDQFGLTPSTRVNSDSDVLLSAGAVYQLSHELELFAGFSENFAAIKNEVLERDASTLTDIVPETAENIDLGVRFSNLDWQVSATVYSIEFDNRITFIAPGSDTGGIDYTVGTNGQYINVGGIESQGLELSAKYQVDQNLSVYSSYTMNDSTYIGNAPGFNAGDKVIDSVDDMFVISTDYTQGNLRSGLSAKYTGERGAAESYTVVDFNLGYSQSLEDAMFESVDIAFVVNNLFDKRYLSTGTGTGETFFIGGPRTATITLTANF